MWPPPSALFLLPLVDIVLYTERTVEILGNVTGKVAFCGVQGHLGSEPDKVKSFYSTGPSRYPGVLLGHWRPRSISIAMAFLVWVA